MAKVCQGVYFGEFMFYCLGCKCHHSFHTITPNESGAIWIFNNDFNKPTIHPSHHVTSGKNGKTLCHSWIKLGMIQYLGDCAHELKGKTIELPEIE